MTHNRGLTASFLRNGGGGGDDDDDDPTWTENMLGKEGRGESRWVEERGQ